MFFLSVNFQFSTASISTLTIIQLYLLIRLIVFDNFTISTIAILLIYFNTNSFLFFIYFNNYYHIFYNNYI